MRTNLSIGELLVVAQEIANLPAQPNIREIPSELKNLLTENECDQFSIGYRRTAGITQFFVQDRNSDLDGEYSTRDLLKRVGAWYSAVTYTIVKTVRWLDGTVPYPFMDDKPVSTLLGFTQVDGGEHGEVVVYLEDPSVMVDIHYDGHTDKVSLSAFLTRFMG